MKPVSPPLRDPRQKLPWRRYAAPAVIIILMITGYAFGLHKQISLHAIAEHRDALLAFTQSHWWLALAAFMGAYIAAVSLSFPGAVLLTVVSGFLFGWKVGGIATVISATIGSGIVFQVTKFSVGDAIAGKAGPLLCKLKDGFAHNAFHYLIFLRLVPVFPFWLVNIASACGQVKLRTFLVATFLGILPGTFTFAYLGQGLDSIITAQKASYQACLAAAQTIPCKLELSLSALVTKELLIGLTCLGLIALIPIVHKKWTRGSTTPGPA